MNLAWLLTDAWILTAARQKYDEYLICLKSIISEV